MYVCNSGIAERLQHVESEETICAKITAGIETFNSMQEILNKFDNVHLVPRYLNENGIMGPNIKKAMEHIAALIDSKMKEKVAEGAACTSKLAVQAALQVALLNKT